MKAVNSGELLKLKPYTTKELSNMFEVCPRTFRSWLKPFSNEIGERRGRFYSVVQVRIIIEKLGAPCVVDLNV